MNEQALLVAIGNMMQENLATMSSMMDEKLEVRLKPIEDRMDQMEKDIPEIKGKTTELGVIIENEIDKAIKLLAEGHEGIIETMTENLVTVEQREKDNIRLFAVEEAVRQHTAQIKELQRKTS